MKRFNGVIKLCLPPMPCLMLWRGDFMTDAERVDTATATACPRCLGHGGWFKKAQYDNWHRFVRWIRCTVCAGTGREATHA